MTQKQLDAIMDVLTTGIVDVLKKMKDAQDAKISQLETRIRSLESFSELLEKRYTPNTGADNSDVSDLVQ